MAMLWDMKDGDAVTSRRREEQRITGSASHRLGERGTMIGGLPNGSSQGFHIEIPHFQPYIEPWRSYLAPAMGRWGGSNRCKGKADLVAISWTIKIL